MKAKAWPFFLTAVFLCQALESQPAQRWEFSNRASKINPLAKEHPEIKFTFAEVKGKHQDLQHAIVDTRVASRDRRLCQPARRRT